MSNWIDSTSPLPSASATEENWVAVTEEAMLEVKGEDAARLLQGQLTADMVKLTPGQSAGAALCNPKGRILALMRVLRTEGGFLIRTAADNQATLLETLKKYAVFFKVSIQPLSDCGVLYSSAAGLPGFDALYDRQRPDASREVWVCSSALTEWLESPQAQRGDEAWRRSQIRCGEPTVYGASSGEYLPHALSLDLSSMISFDKGCYTGQEIVARTHYRGKSKRRLAAISCNGIEVAPGDLLQSEQGNAIADVIMLAQVGDRTEMLLSAVDPLEPTSELYFQQQKLNWSAIRFPWEQV